MDKTVEQVAHEALQKIAEADHWTGRHAKKALDQIEQLKKPTVHNLSAQPLIVDTPPGGGA